MRSDLWLITGWSSECFGLGFSSAVDSVQLHHSSSAGRTAAGRSYFAMATLTKAVIFFFSSFRRLPRRTKPGTQPWREQSAPKITKCKRIFVGSYLPWLGFVIFNVLINDGFTGLEKRVSNSCFSKLWALRIHPPRKGEVWTAKHLQGTFLHLCIKTSSNYFLPFISGWGCFPV